MHPWLLPELCRGVLATVCQHGTVQMHSVSIINRTCRGVVQHPVHEAFHWNGVKHLANRDNKIKGTSRTAFIFLFLKQTLTTRNHSSGCIAWRFFPSLQDPAPEDYATLQVPAADARNTLTLMDYMGHFRFRDKRTLQIRFTVYLTFLFQ